MRKAEDWFVRINGWALILCLGAMTVVVFANVSLRYVTNHSIPWADEVARYLMIWMTFLGAGLALRYGGHVAVTNLQERLPSAGQIALRALIVAGLLVFFVFMVWVGREYMLRMQYQKSPALRLPYIYIYAAMPIGFTLLIAHLLLIAKSYVLAGRHAAEDAAAEDDEPTMGAQNG